jgi:hypothetical protein
MVTVPKYRDKMSVSFRRVKESAWTSWNLKVVPDRLSRNVDRELPLYAAWRPTRAQTSCTSRWKPQITPWTWNFWHAAAHTSFALTVFWTQDRVFSVMWGEAWENVVWLPSVGEIVQRGRQFASWDQIISGAQSSYDWHALGQRFSTAGPRPGTGPWHQL